MGGVLVGRGGGEFGEGMVEVLLGVELVLGGGRGEVERHAPVARSVEGGGLEDVCAATGEWGSAGAGAETGSPRRGRCAGDAPRQTRSAITYQILIGVRRLPTAAARLLGPLCTRPSVVKCWCVCCSCAATPAFLPQPRPPRARALCHTHRSCGADGGQGTPRRVMQRGLACVRRGRRGCGRAGSKPTRERGQTQQAECGYERCFIRRAQCRPDRNPGLPDRLAGGTFRPASLSSSFGARSRDGWRFDSGEVSTGKQAH